MSVVVPICAGCRRRTSDWVCTAYPDGIPDAIVGNEADHRAPYRGDGGKRFLPVADWAADRATDVFGPAPKPVD